MKLRLQSSLALLMIMIAVLPAMIVGGLLLKQQSNVETNYRIDLLSRLSTTITQEVQERFNLLSTSLDVLSRDRLFVQAIDNFFLSSHVNAALGSLVKNAPLVQSAYLVNDQWHEIESYDGIHGTSAFSILKTLLKEKYADKKATGEQWVFNYSDETLMPKKFNPSRKGIIIGVPIYQSTLTLGLKRKPLGFLIAAVPIENIVKVFKPYLKNGERVVFKHKKMGDLIVLERDNTSNKTNISKTIQVDIDNKYIVDPIHYMVEISIGKYLGKNPYVKSLKYLSIFGLVIILCAFFGAGLTYRWIAKPLSELMNIVRAYSNGDYNRSNYNLRFAEFFMVDRLICTMAKTIQSQVSVLGVKNDELSKAYSEKEKANLKLVNFNDQLEIKVEEKTLELSNSLQREEKRRSMLQSLLSFSHKLQNGDITAIIMTQAVSLYPLAGWAMKLYDGVNDDVWVCEKLDSELLVHQEVQPEYHHGHYYCITIGDDILHCFKIKNIRREIIGVIVMKYPVLERDDFEVISLFVSQLSSELEGRLLNDELAKIAVTDALTGLANRKAFDHDLDENVQMLKRYPSRHFGIFMLDINGLKKANDVYGHHMGDSLLVETSKLLVKTCRLTDKVYRLGGDEFAIILPVEHNDSCQVLWQRLEKLRNEEHYASLPNGKHVEVHFAMGYASTDKHSVEQLYIHADKAMYADKQNYYAKTGLSR